jgi:hypothetical protein
VGRRGHAIGDAVWRGRKGLFVAALGIIGFAAVNTAVAADCANEAIRESQTSELLPVGTTYLPDCMALEMLSPPKKFGQEATELSAFSPDGNRAVFFSKAALAGTEGLQSFNGDNYVATRGAGGWTLSPTSPPREARIVGGGSTSGGPYTFASNLTGWTLIGCTQAQMFAGESQVFSGGLDGSFGPLSPLLQPIDDSGNPDISFFCINFFPSGTAADLSATVLPSPNPSTAFLPEDPRNLGGAEDGDNNSYVAFLDEVGEPTLELLARDGAGEVFGGRCGSELGSGAGRIQGAISGDGSRIYFSTRPTQPWNEETQEGPPCSLANPLRILERVETPAGPEISGLLPSAPPGGNDVYQGASLDGSKVFLVTPRNLAASDQDTSPEECSAEIGKSVGCDLYLYDADLPEGERLIQVSAGGAGDPDPGKGANVLGSIAALAPDGSHVYFTAQGVLTTDPNPAGATATAGQPNLYLYQRDAAHPSGRTAFIGTLAAGDQGELWAAGSLAGGSYPVPLLGSDGGDGHVLFFLSDASLTAADADGGHTDVFRYDSDDPEASGLQCVSCAPGGPDSAPFDASAGAKESAPSSNFAEQGRWASEDGQTVAFATAEPLVETDEDEATNPYIWRNAQLAWLPGSVKTFQQLPALSPGGEQVGFTTTAPLLPQDGDTARDVYVVRVAGGFPNPDPEIFCDPLVEGSCQGPPTSPPGGPGPASNSFAGPGNVQQKPKCRKGFVRKQGKCVKRGKKKAGKQSGQKRRANR